VVVGAVGGLMAVVGEGKGGQDLGMDAGVVVAGEAALCGVVAALGVGRHGWGVSHWRVPFTSAAGRVHRRQIVSARSRTSVKPANRAVGFSARIRSLTSALTTRTVAA